MAAMIPLLLEGCSAEAVWNAAKSFTGLPHRMEHIARIANVTYVNDSKATNPAAAQSALEGCESRVVCIAGGRGKGLAFAD